VAPGHECVTPGRTAGDFLTGEADEGLQRGRDPFGVGRVVDGPLDRPPEFALDILGGIALQDLGLRFHDLAERPEAAAVAVRQ
jgi:hypothetical protein